MVMLTLVLNFVAWLIFFFVIFTADFILQQVSALKETMCNVKLFCVIFNCLNIKCLPKIFLPWS